MDAKHDDPPPHHHAGHRGWVRAGGRRGRWIEPFLLAVIGGGDIHGAALIERLDALCLAPAGVDAGMAYRTLRELEAEGLVTSSWVLDQAAPKRVYRLSPGGWAALGDWTGVMRERERLIATYLEQVGAIEPDKGAQT